MQRLLLLALILTLSSGCHAVDHVQKLGLKAGDLLFQSFPSHELTIAIEGVTQSAVSHCGILVEKSEKWFVLEAVGPVTYTPVENWIARSRKGAFWVYRFKPEYEGKIPQFIAAAEAFKGRPYDGRFQFDDEKIYCSELLFKAFKNSVGENLGTVQKLGDMNWKPHEAYIRKVENGGLPLEREMITPRAVTEAPQLVEVYRKGV